MPFGDAGDAVSIANTIALTSGTITAIGGAVPSAGAIGSATSAAGSKLINPAGVVTHKSFNGLGDNVIFDCSGGVSLALDFMLTSVPGAAPGSIIFGIAYTDSTFTETIFEETFELNCGVGGTVIQTCIMDRILGPQCEVVFESVNGITNPVLDLYFLVQNIPVDSRRIVELGLSQEGDGCLGTFSDAALAAGATSGLHVFEAATGNIMVRMAATQAAQFVLKQGYGSLQPFAQTLVANQDTFIIIPATNRPLAYTVKNTGAAAGTFTASAYTTPA